MSKRSIQKILLLTNAAVSCRISMTFMTDSMQQLYLRYKSVSVFGSTAAALAPLAELTVAPDAAACVSGAARVFRAVIDSGCSGTGEWIKKLVLSDDNPFSRAAARGERISPKIKAQVANELLTFKQLSMLKPNAFENELTDGFFPQFWSGGFSLTYDVLTSAYAERGCGVFGEADSFYYSDGEFRPAQATAERLADIKCYAEEKFELANNTQSFINGLPAFHCALIGERGMGKSATVRAVAGDFGGRVKLIQISDPSELCAVTEKIRDLKQKFIIFADAVSLEQWSQTRAQTDKVLDAMPSNYLLYCTVDIQRDGDGTLDKAELALFDRFGLVITYLPPDREQFCEILKQILRSRSIKWRDEYASVAELAARKKGGRSPRAAKQIADIIESAYAQKRCD